MTSSASGPPSDDPSQNFESPNSGSQASGGDSEFDGDALKAALEPVQVDADELQQKLPCEGPEVSEVGHLINEQVVLDTRADITYIGTLVTIGEHFYVLDSADVHDVNTGRTSKEIYILESFKYGIKMNRRRVFVRSSEIVSLSALQDIIDY